MPEGPGRQQHRDRGERCGGDAAQQPATEHGADGQGDEETDEHQRGVELGVAVHREAGEQGDVDQGGDQ